MPQHVLLVPQVVGFDEVQERLDLGDQALVVQLVAVDAAAGIGLLRDDAVLLPDAVDGVAFAPLGHQRGAALAHPAPDLGQVLMVDRPYLGELDLLAAQAEDLRLVERGGGEAPADVGVVLGDGREMEHGCEGGGRRRGIDPGHVRLQAPGLFPVLFLFLGLFLADLGRLLVPGRLLLVAGFLHGLQHRVGVSFFVLGLVLGAGEEGRGGRAQGKAKQQHDDLFHGRSFSFKTPRSWECAGRG